MLETIRLFAAERLAEAAGQEPAAASAAHSAHYLAVAEAAAPHLKGSEPRTWLARLETERANLMRAAEHAAGQPDGTAQVLRFGIALQRYWVSSTEARKRPRCCFPCCGGPTPQPTLRCTPKRCTASRG